MLRARFFGLSQPVIRMSRGAWGTALLGLVLCGAYATHAADETAPAGLKGILPEGVPADLTAAISALPENWKAWGEALSSELTDLYEKTGDVAAQRATIAALQSRLKTVGTVQVDPRYRSISNPLVAIYGSLKRRLEVAQAALDTLQAGPEIRTARVDAAKKQVTQAAAALDRYLASIKGGDSWDKYLQVDDVRGLSDDDKSVVTLAGVQNKLLKGKAEVADARVRDFMQRTPVTNYERAVDAYLAAVGAPSVAANSPALRKDLGALLTAVDNYESQVSSANAAEVRKTFEAVRTSAPDGGDKISAALRTNYFNYNLKVVAHEDFLNRIIAQRRMESGAVRDQVLGANVFGNQTTVTDVTVNLRPSATVAQFDLTATGSVSSNTVGVTDQAQIYTQGNHSFRAEKLVAFNGTQFWTQPARIGVSAHNTTTGADTNINFPILSGIARNIAVGKAEEMRGQSEAIAASRVQENVLPKFNSEVDKEFGSNGTFNHKVSERRAALADEKLLPDAEAYSSTETELRVASRIMGAGELGASEPNPLLVWSRGATILVHESLLNNSFDRLGIAGQTLSDDEFRAKIEGNLSKILGKSIDFGEKPSSPNEDAETKSQSLIFDKADPIRFDISDGALTITLRVGVKQPGKEDIPTQIVSVPLMFSVDMKNVVIEPGSVTVSAAERAPSPATQLARAGVIRKKIEASFPKRELDRVTTIQRDNTKAVVAVTRIKALDGWLSVTFE